MQHQAQHVGVEAAAQALVGGDDDRADALDRRRAWRRNGCLYSVLALRDVQRDAAARARRTGRDARMRSCAFFIFEAATISIALVILRVLCTLLILLRISFEPAMRVPRCLRRRDQYAPFFLKSSIAAASAFSSSAVEVLGLSRSCPSAPRTCSS